MHDGVDDWMPPLPRFRFALCFFVAHEAGVRGDRMGIVWEAPARRQLLFALQSCGEMLLLPMLVAVHVKVPSLSRSAGVRVLCNALSRHV